MIHEQDYICWQANQEESEGIEVQAPTIRAAAKKAADAWRPSRPRGVGGHKVTVFVKDERRQLHQVIITIEKGNENASEANL